MPGSNSARRGTWARAFVNALSIGAIGRAGSVWFPTVGGLVDALVTSGVAVLYLWVLTETRKDDVAEWIEKWLLRMPSTLLLVCAAGVAIALPVAQIRCEGAPQLRITEVGATSAPREIDCEQNPDVHWYWGFRPHVRVESDDGRTARRFLLPLVENAIDFPKDFRDPVQALFTLNLDAVQFLAADAEADRARVAPLTDCDEHVSYCVEVDGMMKVPLGPNGLVVGSKRPSVAAHGIQMQALQGRYYGPATSMVRTLTAGKSIRARLHRHVAGGGFRSCDWITFQPTEEDPTCVLDDKSCQH